MDMIKSHACHGGTLEYYSHESAETKTSMRFSVFHPPEGQASGAMVVFLSGLTCTEDNFTTKAGAYRKAAELGLCILAPDTSPRGEGVPDDEAYDLGQGAGFYIDATQEPWSHNFRMESYIVKELVPQCIERFGIDSSRVGISGHSMGGHGALTLHFKYPGVFPSCSAFSPIVAPTQVPWGQKGFGAYLGDDQDAWRNHDACILAERSEAEEGGRGILIDQGLSDDFLNEQLKPELFEAACKKSGQSVTIRLHDGYDHSYFFIQSFIDDHLKWHADCLK